MFKLDEMVAVCYDGKWGRAVHGKVIEVAPKTKREKYVNLSEIFRPLV